VYAHLVALPSRRGRSPLGAFYRSPLGAFTRGAIVAALDNSFTFLAQRLSLRLHTGSNLGAITHTITANTPTFHKEGVVALLRNYLAGPFAASSGGTTNASMLYPRLISPVGFSALAPDDTYLTHPGWSFLPQSGGLNDGSGSLATIGGVSYYPIDVDTQSRDTFSTSWAGNVLTLSVVIRIVQGWAAARVPAHGVAMIFRGVTGGTPERALFSSAIFDSVPPTIASRFSSFLYELDMELP
jgi:hypothetical protein